jgi:ABC-type polar amino acid transport system ATPase subunit
MNKPFIQIDSLVKRYGATVAVDGVSLSMDEGHITAIIGASGCGKSTFLRCVNLLENPTSGSLRIGDDTLAYTNSTLSSGEERALSYRKSMAMVFQSFELFPHMSVLRNVALAPAIVNGVPLDQAIEQAHALLDRVGLHGKANEYPGQLSGGQSQRVAIARALAMSPRVLLFDEATSALDPELVGEVLEVIGELADEGRTMIVVTHELEFAKDVADTLVFFDQGRVVETGKPHEMIDNPQSERLGNFLKRYQRIRTRA